MKTVKTSNYRQRGYLLSSGEFVIVYGEDASPVDAGSRLVWDNQVNTVTTTVSNLTAVAGAEQNAEHAD